MSTLSGYMEHGQSAARSTGAQTGALLALMGSSYIALTLSVQGFVGMLPFVQREFSLTGAQAGLYTSFYFLSATAIAVLSGRIVDRIGPRNGLAIGTATVGLMMLLHAVSPSYSLILALAFVTGVGFSLITPSVSKGVITFVSARRRAGAMGVVHGLGGVGALVGTGAMPAAAQLYGWRPVLSASAGIALLVAATILAMFQRFARASLEHGGHEDARASGQGAGPDEFSSVAAHESVREPSGHTSAERADAPGTRSLSGDLKRILSDTTFLSICVLGITFGVSLSSVTGHMALFLVQDLDYSPAIAGLTLSWFHIGGVFGQPGWGYINDRFFDRRRRRGLLLLAALTALMSLFFGVVVSTGVLPVAGLFAASALLGFSIFGMPGLYFTTISELVPHELTGLATGVALVFTRAGVVFAAPVFGLLSDLTGDYRLSWFVLAAAVAFLGAAVLVSTRRSVLSQAVRRRAPGVGSS